MDSSGLESQLAEAQERIESFRQWNKRLKEKNQELRAVLEKKESHIAELETELATCREQLEAARRANPSGNEGHGLCSLVIRMREEGNTDEEIAEHLKGKGLSRAIVGALMTRDENVIAEQSYRVKADRLMKK